jgi:predicted dehydrogenase
MAIYRVGIVGCTGIASAPARELSHPIMGAVAPHSHAAGYNCVPATEVVAVCDLIPERTQDFVSKWQHRWPGITQYQDYGEMLARENLDIVSVVTSDHRHADITVAAAEAGARAIFCEKPLATTLADADRMIAAIEKHGVFLSVDHSRRWQPDWFEAREAIRNGTIGPVRTVIGKLGGARAMLFRNGTHLTDAICFFADGDPEWISARFDDQFADYGPRYAGDGGRDPATDPGICSFILFSNGVRAFYSGSRDVAAGFEVEVMGETGRIRLGNGIGAEIETADGVQALPPASASVSGSAAAIEELIALVEGRTSLPQISGPYDGRRVVEILVASVKSAAQAGAPVTIPFQE